MICANRKSSVSLTSSMNRMCFSALPSARHVIHRAISVLDDGRIAFLTNHPSMNRMRTDINRCYARIATNRLSLDKEVALQSVHLGHGREFWFIFQDFVIQRSIVHLVIRRCFVRQLCASWDKDFNGYPSLLHNPRPLIQSPIITQSTLIKVDSMLRLIQVVIREPLILCSQSRCKLEVHSWIYRNTIKEWSSFLTVDCTFKRKCPRSAKLENKNTLSI